MKEFLQKVVSAFVDHPKDVKVEEKSLEDGTVLLTLSVHSEDMGKVIGKGGKIAKALRLALRIPAIKSGQRISLEIAEAS